MSLYPKLQILTMPLIGGAVTYKRGREIKPLYLHQWLNESDIRASYLAVWRIQIRVTWILIKSGVPISRRIIMYYTRVFLEMAYARGNSDNILHANINGSTIFYKGNQTHD